MSKSTDRPPIGAQALLDEKDPVVIVPTGWAVPGGEVNIMWSNGSIQTVAIERLSVTRVLS